MIPANRARKIPAPYRLFLVAITAAAVAVTLAFLALDLDNGRKSALAAQEESLVSLSASIAAELDGVFQQVSLSFIALDEWIAGHPGRDPLRDQAFMELAARFRLASGLLVRTCLADPDGRLFPLGEDGKGGATDLGSRDYLAAQRNPLSYGYYIGSPEWNPLSGAWSIPVSYPLRSPVDGKSILVALIDLPALNLIFAPFRPQAGGTVGILDASGRIMDRMPFDAGYIGSRLEVPPQGEMSRLVDPGLVAISYQDGVDRVRRLFAFRTVGKRGLYITVSAVEAEVLRGWKASIAPLVAAAAFFLVIVLLVAHRLFNVLIQLTEARKELEGTVARLEANKATKDRLISIISHDLRSPIGGMKNLLEGLVEDRASLSPEELGESLTALAEAAGSTYELLEDLLAWSSSQRGSIRFAPSRFLLRPVAEDCAGAMAQARAKNVSIVADMAEDVPIRADEDMLRTILRNLLSNAVKYSEPGSRVTIGATADAEKTVLRVSDQGQGMDEDTVGRLFRVESTRSRPGTAGERGFGFGLAVVKDFVERHGGSIAVVSAPGRGSTFELVFPGARDGDRAGPEAGSSA